MPEYFICFICLTLIIVLFSITAMFFSAFSSSSNSDGGSGGIFGVGLPWVFVVALGLSLAAALRLSCPLACGILVLQPGIKPTSPA